MKEEWRQLTDWPDYKISNHGQVYSYRRNRFLKSRPNSSGQPCVSLQRDGCWNNTVSVPRLVAIEFVTGYFEGAVVKYIDGDKNNCRADNLRWSERGKLRKWVVVDEDVVPYDDWQRLEALAATKEPAQENVLHDRLSELVEPHSARYSQVYDKLYPEGR